jgi:hypothetical protein
MRIMHPEVQPSLLPAIRFAGQGRLFDNFRLPHAPGGKDRVPIAPRAMIPRTHHFPKDRCNRMQPNATDPAPTSRWPSPRTVDTPNSPV